jgi:hypothetical protein
LYQAWGKAVPHQGETMSAMVGDPVAHKHGATEWEGHAEGNHIVREQARAQPGGVQA